MGNTFRREEIDPQYLEPSGLYKSCSWDDKVVKKMITDRKIAPRFLGADASQPNLEECPICLLFYPGGLNRSKCCRKPICTECFLQVKNPNKETSQCPFCMKPNYAVTFSGPMTEQEKKQIELEEQKVLELQISIRNEEIRRDKEREESRYRSLTEPTPRSQSSSSLSASPVSSPQSVSGAPVERQNSRSSFSGTHVRLESHSQSVPSSPTSPPPQRAEHRQSQDLSRSPQQRSSQEIPRSSPQRQSQDLSRSSSQRAPLFVPSHVTPPEDVAYISYNIADFLPSGFDPNSIPSQASDNYAADLEQLMLAEAMKLSMEEAPKPNQEEKKEDEIDKETLELIAKLAREDMLARKQLEQRATANHEEEVDDSDIPIQFYGQMRSPGHRTQPQRSSVPQAQGPFINPYAQRQVPSVSSNATASGSFNEGTSSPNPQTQPARVSHEEYDDMLDYFGSGVPSSRYEPERNSRATPAAPAQSPVSSSSSTASPQIVTTTASSINPYADMGNPPITDNMLADLIGSIQIDQLRPPAESSAAPPIQQMSNDEFLSFLNDIPQPAQTQFATTPTNDDATDFADDSGGADAE